MLKYLHPYISVERKLEKAGCNVPFLYSWPSMYSLSTRITALLISWIIFFLMGKSCFWPVKTGRWSQSLFLSAVFLFFLLKMLKFSNNRPGSGRVGVQTVNTVKGDIVESFWGEFQMFYHEILNISFRVVCGCLCNLSGPGRNLTWLTLEQGWSLFVPLPSVMVSVLCFVFFLLVYSEEQASAMRENPQNPVFSS